MNFEDGVEMIIKAKERDQEDKAWSMWIALHPHMDEESFIPFEQFYVKQATVQSTPIEKSSADILLDVDDIIRMTKKVR